MALGLLSFPRRLLSGVGALTSIVLVSALVGVSPTSEPITDPAAVVAAGSAVDAAARTRWTGTWATAPYVSFASAKNTTFRMVVHTSVGGDRVRVHLSNRFGEEPVQIGPATVGLQASGAGIVPGTLRQLTFDGLTRTTIPDGADVISDPVKLDVPALGTLSVSVYVPDAAVGAEHSVGDGTAYVSTAGNHVAELGPASYPTTRGSYLFLSGVDVTRTAGSTIVAMGDSITDGGTTTDGRYPSVLAARLQADLAYEQFGVVNAGIGASELLQTAALFGLSEPGITRADRDVLLQTNVRTVVIMMGTNDILGAHAATGAEVIAGLKQFTTKAHAAGIRVMGGTITPCACYDPTRESYRQQVNDWVRTTSALDAVVDFDEALRDPSSPQRLLPAYDSGDGLHPSAAGYQAMANAIDLQALTSVR